MVHQLDAGPERSLEELGVGRGDGAPLERVQVGREEPGRIDARDVAEAMRLGVKHRAPSSSSQTTSSGRPWLSSSRQTRRTRVEFPSAGGATTPSTSHWRWRTATMSPSRGA